MPAYEEASFHISPFFAKLITTPSENFENVKYPRVVETSMVLLLGSSMLLNVVQVLFRVRQLFKNATQRSTSMTGTVATLTPQQVMQPNQRINSTDVSISYP